MFNYHNEKFLKSKFVKTTVIDALFYFIVYLYLSFLSPYLGYIGWSEFAQGWFFSIFAITGIIVAPIIGAISDKVGRYHILIIGFIFEIIAITGYILLNKAVFLFPLRIVSAIAFNMVVITALSRINDTATNKERSQRTSIFQSILSAATMVAPLIGGVIADAFGYKAVFMTSLLFALTILVGILVHDKLFFKDTSPHRKKGKISVRDGNPLTDIFDMLKIKQLRPVAILGMFLSLTSPINIMVLPFIIIEKMGLSNTQLSIALFIMGAAHMGQFLIGFLVDKLGRSKSIIIGLSIFSVALTAMFFAPNYNVLILLILIKAIGGSLWNISAWAYISDIAEGLNIEGKIVGSYTALVRSGQALSFIIAGSVLALWQEGIFLFFALISAVPLILLAKKIIKFDPGKITIKKN